MKLPNILIGAVLALLMLFFAVGCSSSASSSEMEQYDDAMAAQDWGKDYYYNRNSHSVEKNLHGMLG